MTLPCKPLFLLSDNHNRALDVPITEAALGWQKPRGRGQAGPGRER